MSPKTLSVILMVVGLIILIVFSMADVFGLGQHPDQFGPRQITGTIVGLGLLIAGVVIYFRQR